MNHKMQKSAPEVSLKTKDSAKASEATVHNSVIRKRNLSSKEPSSASSADSVSKRKRPKFGTDCKPENENILQKANTQESVPASDKEPFVPAPEPFRDPNIDIPLSDLDMSVIDTFGHVSLKKRVSFGKVFCKKFSSAKKLSAKSVPLLTAPSRGILRR
ncbi:hypothetical protein Aperf_G00000072339 [Anoplocephala perfoliata]